MNQCYINKPVISFVFPPTLPSIPYIRWDFRVRGSALFSVFDAYSPNRTVGEGCVCVSSQQKVNAHLLSARYCAKSLTCINSFHWSSCQFYELGTTFLPIWQMRMWRHWASIQASEGHTAGQGQGWDLQRGGLVPGPTLYPSSSPHITTKPGSWSPVLWIRIFF